MLSGHWGPSVPISDSPVTFLMTSKKDINKIKDLIIERAVPAEPQMICLNKQRNSLRLEPRDSPLSYQHGFKAPLSFLDLKSAWQIALNVEPLFQLEASSKKHTGMEPELNFPIRLKTISLCCSTAPLLVTFLRRLKYSENLNYCSKRTVKLSLGIFHCDFRIKAPLTV